eukprot:455552_1
MTDYKHQALKVKCCIQSATINKNVVNIKIPSTNDWDKILKSLLFKITNRKFKFLSKMDDSQWYIQTINNDIIDKTDGNAFKKILSSIPPIAVIEIVATKSTTDIYIITIYYKQQKFNCKLFGDKDKWDEETFNELKQAVRKEFDLETE